MFIRMLFVAATLTATQVDLLGQAIGPEVVQPSDVDTRSTTSDADVEVLLKGPLHEAFAEQFTNDVEPSIIVNKAPPDAIEEIPSEFKPDLPNTIWIPGYWGWDPDQDDFLWVSGIWRQIPVGQQWVPGYWTEVEGGYQWISGYWDAEANLVATYLPAPPPSIDNGPSSSPPDDNHFWISGCWVYRDNDYVWRSGYWHPVEENYIWVPTRYVWTPSGCIYRGGYWDYQVANRGTIFCPVRFRGILPGLRYRPQYVVDASPTLFANLFVYPRYHHYLFGNYYQNRRPNDIYAWALGPQDRRSYDQLYSHYAYQRQDADFITQVSRMHRFIAQSSSDRPVATLAAYQQRALTGEAPSTALQIANIVAIAAQSGQQSRPFNMKQVGVEAVDQVNNDIKLYRESTAKRREVEKASTAEDKSRAIIQDDKSMAKSSTRLSSEAKPKRVKVDNTTRVNSDKQRSQNTITLGANNESKPADNPSASSPREETKPSVPAVPSARSNGEAFSSSNPQDRLTPQEIAARRNQLQKDNERQRSAIVGNDPPKRPTTSEIENANKRLQSKADQGPSTTDAIRRDAPNIPSPNIQLPGHSNQRPNATEQPKRPSGAQSENRVVPNDKRPTPRSQAQPAAPRERPSVQPSQQPKPKAESTPSKSDKQSSTKSKAKSSNRDKK
jgi:hypothetical protein